MSAFGLPGGPKCPPMDPKRACSIVGPLLLELLREIRSVMNGNLMRCGGYIAVSDY